MPRLFYFKTNSLGDFHFVCIFKIHHRRESSSKVKNENILGHQRICVVETENVNQNKIKYFEWFSTSLVVMLKSKKTWKTLMHGKERLGHDEVDWNYLDSWSICKVGKAKVKSIYIMRNHEKYFKFHHNTFNHGDPGC